MEIKKYYGVATVLIIDDQYAIRLGLSALLHKEFSNISVHQALNTDAIEFLLDHPGIDLIIWGPNYEDKQLLFEKFIALKSLALDTPVLLHCDCHHTEFDLLSCLSAGARGFLPKTARLPEYLTAISTVMEGRTYLANDVKAYIVKMLLNYKHQPSPPSPFR